MFSLRLILGSCQIEDFDVDENVIYMNSHGDSSLFPTGFDGLAKL